jgi:hypothetical protein
MATQKFMGRGQLIDRLTAQMGSRDAAVSMLIKRGHLKPDGKTFTPEGAARNRMTAEERAIDRTATRLRKSTGQFVYDPTTNTAKLKSRR